MTSTETQIESSSRSDVLLDIEKVTLSFGGLIALSQVSLHIRPGEVLGLIGPNGSGESTLFNSVTGFLKPDTGLIHFKGNNITGSPAYKISSYGMARTLWVRSSPKDLRSSPDGKSEPVGAG